MIRSWLFVVAGSKYWSWHWWTWNDVQSPCSGSWSSLLVWLIIDIVRWWSSKSDFVSGDVTLWHTELGVKSSFVWTMSSIPSSVVLSLVIFVFLFSLIVIHISAASLLIIFSGFLSWAFWSCSLAFLASKKKKYQRRKKQECWSIWWNTRKKHCDRN